MPDVPSASAVSPASASSATSSGSNNIVVEASVSSVPDKIQQLSRQIEVSGTLASPPSGNMVTINTAIGPLTLILPQLVQAQQEKLIQQLTNLFQNQRPLTVVLQPGNPPAQAFLLLPASTSAQSTANAYNFLPPLSAAAQSAPPLTVNITLSAVVLPNSNSAMPAPPAGQNPSAGIGQNLAAYSTPTAPLAADAESAALANETQASANFQSAAPAISTAAPQSDPVLALLQKPGAELSLQVNTIGPPSSPNTPALVPQAPNQIVATVVGNGPGGQLILKAGDATLFVRQPINAPPGTQLLLTVEQAKPSVPTLLTFPDRQDFAGLQQIIAALNQIDPAAAQALIAEHIPQPGESMPGALLFFLSAMRQGDMSGWLGSGALDMLARAGKAELITKLVQDLRSMAGQTARDGVVGEWHTYPVPVHDNNQLNVFYLHVHGDQRRHQGSSHGGGGKEDAGEKQMRFVIDIRMSRLGALQLDGFLRPRQLDIIMRSEHTLPRGFDQELRDTYARTLGAIGYIGAISFQAGRQGWINVQMPAAGKAVVT